MTIPETIGLRYWFIFGRAYPLHPGSSANPAKKMLEIMVDNVIPHKLVFK